MKIIRSTPKLELTEKEYHLLDDTYALIAAIDSNLPDIDWSSLNPDLEVSLLEVKNAIGTLLDWSADEL